MERNPVLHGAGFRCVWGTAGTRVMGVGVVTRYARGGRVAGYSFSLSLCHPATLPPECAECRFHDPPNDDLVLLPDQPAAEGSVNLNVKLRYLCLVYEDEEKTDALAERESEFIATENLECPGELESEWSLRCRSQVAAGGDGHHDPRPRRLGLHLQWRRRRDEGAIRCVLPHRRQGSERRHPDRREDAGGTPGIDRSTAARGMQLWLTILHQEQNADRIRTAAVNQQPGHDILMGGSDSSFTR